MCIVGQVRAKRQCRDGGTGPTTPTLVGPKCCHLWSNPCIFRVLVGPIIIVRLRWFSLENSLILYTVVCKQYIELKIATVASAALRGWSPIKVNKINEACPFHNKSWRNLLLYMYKAGT